MEESHHQTIICGYKGSCKDRSSRNICEAKETKKCDYRNTGNSPPSMPELVEEWRKEPLITKCLSKTEIPKLRLDNSILQELQTLFVEVPSQIRVEEDANAVILKLQEIQSYKSRVASAQISVSKVQTELNKIFSVAESYLLQKPEIAACRNQGMQYAIIKDVARELVDKQEDVKHILNSCEFIQKNLHSTYNSIHTQLDMVKQVGYWKGPPLK